MDKLHLNLEDLDVESFKTKPEAEQRKGTVQAHTHDFDCDQSGYPCTADCENTTGDHLACNCYTQNHFECTGDPCYGGDPTGGPAC